MTLLNSIPDLLPHPSFTFLFGLVIAFSILYGTVQAIRRLYLSPIACIPGPKLAALTHYYEAYYDLISGGGGNFTRQIKKMHDSYGMFIKPAIFQELSSDIYKVRLFGLIPLKFISMIRSTSKPSMLPQHRTAS